MAVSVRVKNGPTAQIEWRGAERYTYLWIDKIEGQPMWAAPLQKWAGSSASLRTRRVPAFEEPAAQKGNENSNQHDAADDQKRAHPIT